MNKSYEFINQRREQLQYYFDTLIEKDYQYFDDEFSKFFHFECYSENKNVLFSLILEK